ncbi:MAG: hypothetical protein Ct9H300mP16_06830 [Pseudomonadota bacterium]|nr:MAG: hypothetical protein Ct9H300mP16_06830 [Pseudomonadota bacterium]
MAKIGLVRFFKSCEGKRIYLDRVDDRRRDHRNTGCYRPSSDLNYTARTQATEGLNLAGSAKTGIIEFQDIEGKWPTNNAEAGLDISTNYTGIYVNSVEVASNVITISFASGVHSGKAITLSA